MNVEEIQILAQLIEAMDDSLRRLEEYYEKKDIENFNKAKKNILDFQEKIDRILNKY